MVKHTEKMTAIEREEKERDKPELTDNYHVRCPLLHTDAQYSGSMKY